MLLSRYQNNNSTTNSLSAVVAAATLPTDARRVPGGMNRMVIIPYGVDASTHTAKIKLTGWDVLDLGGLYIPRILAEMTVTLSTTLPGVDNTYIPSAQSFATTLALDSGTDTSRNIINITNGIASLDAELPAVEYVSLQLSKNADVTSINALYGFYYREQH